MHRLLQLVCILVAAGPAFAGTVPVSACGQSVPPSTTGQVVSDLLCVGGVGVSLGRRANLDLNGHTITIVDPGSGVTVAVGCERACRVFSSAAQPGRLVGPGAGVALSRGINGAARVEDVEIAGFDYGISAGRLQVRRVVVTGCQKFGIYAETLVATDVTADANLNGIAVNRRARATGLRARDNLKTGVDGGRAFVGRDVTVTGNGIWGIDTSAGDGGTGPIVVHGGTVTGNGVDLVSGKRPRLSDATCDHSLHRDDQGTDFGSWGVCALD